MPSLSTLLRRKGTVRNSIRSNQWTKATIENPAKKQKHLKSFSLHVRGRELYSKDEANSLEADLQPLVGGGVITRISKHDSNPEHNPQMPERYRKRGVGEAGPTD